MVALFTSHGWADEAVARICCLLLPSVDEAVCYMRSVKRNIPEKRLLIARFEVYRSLGGESAQQ